MYFFFFNPPYYYLVVFYCSKTLYASFDLINNLFSVTVVLDLIVNTPVRAIKLIQLINRQQISKINSLLLAKLNTASIKDKVQEKKSRKAIKIKHIIEKCTK